LLNADTVVNVDSMQRLTDVAFAAVCESAAVAVADVVPSIFSKRCRSDAFCCRHVWWTCCNCCHKTYSKTDRQTLV